MENKKDQCLNCGYILETGYPYCKNCGQKSKKRLLSVGELITTAFIFIFNFDGPFFKSLFLIFKPWRLTENYITGKRISYYHPARLFLILLILHFGTILSLVNLDNNKTRSNEHFTKLERSLLLEKYLKLEDSIPQILNKSVTDTLRKHLFTNAVLPEKDYLDFNNNFGFKEFRITRKDAIELSRDSIFRKYKIEGFYDQLLVTQMIKLDLDRAGGIRYLVKNFGWAVIIIVALLALLFKLLYIKQNFYYAEHLVFWLNVHSTSFFIVILSILLYKVLNAEDTQYSAFIVLFVPYFSMLFYYKQGWMKTLIKYIITGLFYITICFTIALAFSILSLLIY
jgi:hypothetical protein